MAQYPQEDWDGHLVLIWCHLRPARTIAFTANWAERPIRQREE